MTPLEIADHIRKAYPGASGYGLEAAAMIEKLYAVTVEANLLLENIRQHGSHDNWKGLARAVKPFLAPDHD